MVKKYKFDWKATKDKIKKEEEQKAVSFGDDRFWKLDIDKDTKKGSAIIRFLPDREGTPYKKYFSHWFIYDDGNGNKKYYTEKCATTVGKPCPVCEKNRDLFNSAYESDKEVARERKRRIHYVANIEVIKDQAHEENNGKVKLFDFGPQVFDKYHTAMFGKELTDDEKKEAEDMGVEIKEQDLFVPCDFEEGRNFFYRSTLRDTTGKQKWNTYENSSFQPASNIRPGLDGKEWDEAIAEIMEQTVVLDEWSDPQNFPHENKVQAKLGAILGNSEVSETNVEPESSGTGIAPKTDDDETSEDPELDEMKEEKPAHDQDDEDFLKDLLDE